MWDNVYRFDIEVQLSGKTLKKPKGALDKCIMMTMEEELGLQEKDRM